ncbi:DUF4192 family protein [Kitasatospora sp. NPDC092039]|uniref:DUF4192 family protein n=1 Tax=Kitasatospora sp. NPDC092039 TaxID=3364086 RepID=UPI003813F4B0
MSDNSPHILAMAELADFTACALGREPAGEIVLAEFGEPLRLLCADIPEDPNRVSSFARAFIGDVGELPATSAGQRSVAVLIYARAGHRIEHVDLYAVVWHHLAVECARHGLTVIESQFITPTHWRPLPAQLSAAFNPRAAMPPTGDRHAADDDAEDTGGVVAEILRAFAQELEAGREDTKQNLMSLLDAMLTGRRDIEELTAAQAAQLLLAAQNEDFLNMASAYCEPAEVKRAMEIWSRVAALGVGPYRHLAAAPLTLLGIALLLDGNAQAAGGAFLFALDAKPGGDQAQALLELVSLDERDQLAGVQGIVAAELRAALSRRREQ